MGRCFSYSDSGGQLSSVSGSSRMQSLNPVLSVLQFQKKFQKRRVIAWLFDNSLMFQVALVSAQSLRDVNRVEAYFHVRQESGGTLGWQGSFDLQLPQSRFLSYCFVVNGLDSQGHILVQHGHCHPIHSYSSQQEGGRD